MQRPASRAGPNGHTGWIRARAGRGARRPDGSIAVKLSARRVTVYRDGRVVRRFRAVVGSPPTPTPRGEFFIEEALALSPLGRRRPVRAGHQRALERPAGVRRRPGQIALHGTNNLSGALGTAASHGCIRLSTAAITWLARRIGAGVPLTITR